MTKAQEKQVRRTGGGKASQQNEAGEHAAFWKGDALPFVGSELRDGQHADNYQQITN